MFSYLLRSTYENQEVISHVYKVGQSRYIISLSQLLNLQVSGQSLLITVNTVHNHQSTMLQPLNWKIIVTVEAAGLKSEVNVDAKQQIYFAWPKLQTCKDTTKLLPKARAVGLI